VYRIEIDEASAAVAGAAGLEFECQDALDQVTAIGATRQPLESGNSVSL